MELQFRKMEGPVFSRILQLSDFPEGTTIGFHRDTTCCDECNRSVYVSINLPESEGMGADSNICGDCFLRRWLARELEHAVNGLEVTLGEALPVNPAAFDPELGLEDTEGDED